MTTMPRRSAGLLMYRIKDGVLQVLLAHPGGPHFVKKDEGAWTIPKGEPDAITCNTFERTGVRGK